MAAMSRWMPHHELEEMAEDIRRAAMEDHKHLVYGQRNWVHWADGVVFGAALAGLAALIVTLVQR